MQGVHPSGKSGGSGQNLRNTNDQEKYGKYPGVWRTHWLKIYFKIINNTDSFQFHALWTKQDFFFQNGLSILSSHYD